MKNEEITFLLNECLAGKKKSFEPITSFFKDKIYRMCYRILGTPQDAEDATMDVFIKAYNSLNSYNPQYAFSTWLFKIAINHSIQILRRQKVETDFIFNQSLNPAISVHTQSPETIYLNYYKQDALSSAIENLPVKYRTALMLKYQEDLSYEQIGEILDIPVNTVGSLILRGKKELKEILGKSDFLTNNN